MALTYTWKTAGHSGNYNSSQVGPSAQIVLKGNEHLKHVHSHVSVAGVQSGSNDINLVMPILMESWIAIDGGGHSNRSIFTRRSPTRCTGGAWGTFGGTNFGVTLYHALGDPELGTNFRCSYDSNDGTDWLLSQRLGSVRLSAGELPFTLYYEITVFALVGV